MSNKILRFIERYLTRKIGVEIKCCLMFFMILCFYSGYRLIGGVTEAGIIHMLEMVLLAYLLGWIQALVGSDFDEVDSLCVKDWAVVLAGSSIYTLASFVFGWFEKNLIVTAIFAGYMVVTYLCIFLIHKMKRAIDAKLLNDDLRQFQQRNKDNQGERRMKTKAMNTKLLLVAALGHLLCWAGGDLLLYLVPNGPLDVMGLFDYNRTAEMLQGVNPVQFTISGIAGTIAMMLALLGYYQIYQFLKPVAKGAANVTLAGALLTTIPGAVMHFTCTSMLWYFVKSGATEEAHDTMLAFFMETAVTSAMCNIGVFMVCIALFITVVKGKTCLPKWACFVNTIPLTVVASIALAGMGAMNVGSALMFLGLYFCIRKYSSAEASATAEMRG